MPKRKNAFQDLIAEIHEQMAAPHRVCESDMLVDRVSGQEREVDIVIRTALAGYEFVLSVECTACGRPASVEWVEQMYCKHSNLPTHKLVLVSNAGFTASALDKAKFLGIECHSLDSANKVEWTKYVDRHSSIFLAAIDTVIVVAPSSPTYKLESSYKGIPMDTLFLDAQGKFRATAEDIAHAILAKDSLTAATINKIDSDGGGWEILIPMQSGVRMRLPNGDEHEVHKLKVAVLANPLMMRFEMEQAAFRDAQIAYGSSSNDKGAFLVTILEAKGRSVNAQVRVRRPWGEVKTYSLAGKTYKEKWSVASDEAMMALVRRTDNKNKATHDVAPHK